MSVALPVTAVVFGSVTPPQDDIADLRVHLGCSNEISSFDCLLQNFDKKYSPGGTYPIDVGADGSISLGRGANCPLVLTLKVEEIEPLSTATENYIRIKGRCWGEQLFRRLVTKSWENVKGETVVKYIIENYTLLSHVRNSIELIEDTDTTYTRLDYENTPAFDIIKYIAETADKAGVIGYDFRVAPDGKFEFFPKNTKTSTVSLTERLEVSEYAKNIHRIRNKITVYGAPERKEPPDGDSWTESLTNWTATLGTLFLMDVNAKVGSYNVGCRAGIGLYPVKFKRTFSPPIGYQSLKFWIKVFTTPTQNILRLLAPDAGNYFETIITNFSLGAWVFYDLTLGRKNEYHPIQNTNGIWTKVGSPSWSDIQAIEFDFNFNITDQVVHIDGLFFDLGRWKATREDASSQTQYGLREKVETDEELHSDAECDYRAKALLDFLKGPLETLKVRSEVLDYGTTPILAGDKIHVIIPNENIDADYRVISAEYKASGIEQTLEIELELAKETQLLADFIYGFRKSILKLDKYKASAAVVGAAGGGGGGGGMVQHANEWHDPDMALKSDCIRAFAVLTPLGAVLPSSGAPAQSKITGTNFTYYVLDFDPTTDEVCFFQFKMPPDYVIGTSIIIVIQWISTVNSGSVVWAIQILGRANGEAYDAALSGVQIVTTNAPGTAGQIATSEITLNSPDLQPNDIVVVKIFRDADNVSDTMAADARMVMAGVKL